MPSDSPFPDPEPGLDAAVRAHLDAEAGRHDGRAMADRVLARLAVEAKPARRPRRWWKAAAAVGAGAAVAVAAAVLVAVFAVPNSRESTAAPTPVEVVREARVAYTRTDARCYRVTIDGRARDAFPALAPVPERTLCTRGDRFVVEPGFGGKGAWGSDGSGRVWIAPTTDAAAAFDESELPPALRNAVTIHELEPDELLDEVLGAFDLAWSEPPGAAADAYSVTATRRGDTPPQRLESAVLVVERGTKAVRSLTLRRRGPGGGQWATTFTLLSTGPKDDAAFTPEAHLRPGAPVHDRTRPLLRGRLLRQHLGPSADAP